MIYLDSSVALARLFGEAVRPPPSFWDQHLTSSRLLVYEVWNRVHARRLVEALRPEIAALLAGVTILDMDETTLAAALDPFPVPVRTLDALHLATMRFLRGRGRPIEVASYDARLVAAAAAIGIRTAALT